MQRGSNNNFLLTPAPVNICKVLKSKRHTVFTSTGSFCLCHNSLLFPVRYRSLWSISD